MPIELDKPEVAAIIPSLQKYFREEFDEELSGLRAKFLLDYFMHEIAPFAYNRGVRDAETYFRAKVEDLSATCFETGLTYWNKKSDPARTGGSGTPAQRSLPVQHVLGKA